MRAVYIRIRHDNNAVITKFLGVVIVFNASTQSGDECGNFGKRYKLVEARALDVQNLSFEGKNRLEFAISTLFSPSIIKP